MAIIVLSQRRARTSDTGGNGISMPRIPLAAVAFAASTVFLMLFADAYLHDRAFFDTAILEWFTSNNSGAAEAVFDRVNLLTSSEGAIAMWSLTLITFVALRWWIPAMAVFALPIGGIINEGVGMIAGRERPSGEEFARAAETTAYSFPSGHVMGAVMLYGLLFVVANRIPNTYVRNAVRGGSLAVLLLVGPARLWDGAHWPSDVIGAYTLGALVLSGILFVYLKAERSWGGLPLIKRGYVAHDETVPHAHALTSVVVFEGQRVSKIYSPGLLPRLLYAVSYQASFPYIRNRAALDAAVARRNLAGLLTQYWYGDRRVARAIEVEERGGQLALVGEFVEGHEASDKGAAKAWLTSLRENFEQSGLPTWQIDPRQPRAADNVLETPDGRYMVVDLESGLVAPIASPKVWARAFRRGLIPLFDDIHADRTRAYVEAEAEQMKATLGTAWYAELVATLDEAEATQQAWRDAEPRLIGRFAGGFWSGWNYQAWPQRMNKVTARGQEKADRVMNQAVSNWADDGRITAVEAAELRGQIQSQDMRAVMPHLGAHGVITIFLRFPFGSIARPAWTMGALLFDTGRLFARRISLGDWKRSWTLHSPVVIVLSAIPGFGGFAYLAARPVRRNRLLVRAVLDTLAMKVPGGLYEKTGARLVVARQPGSAPARSKVVPYIGQEWQVPQQRMAA